MVGREREVSMSHLLKTWEDEWLPGPAFTHCYGEELGSGLNDLCSRPSSAPNRV